MCLRYNIYNERGFTFSLSLSLSLLNVWCVEEKRAGERFEFQI